MYTMFLKTRREFLRRRLQVVGLVLIIAIIVGATGGATRAGRMMAHTRAAWYEDLRVADLEIRCSPTRPSVAGAALDVPGVAAAEGRMLLRGRFRAPGLNPLPALVRVLPASPPRPSCR